jgi:hypothetical protein
MRVATTLAIIATAAASIVRKLDIPVPEDSIRNRALR